MKALNTLRGATGALILGLIAASLALGTFTTAQAQAARAVSTSKAGEAARAEQPVVAEITQWRVVTGADGKEAFENADSVKPGNIIEYRVKYTNRGKEPVSRFAANLPVPQGTEYVAKSASANGTPVTVAANDGRYAAEPLMRTVPGKAKPEPVPYAEYRHMRWNLDQIAPGAVREVKARVRVQAYELPKPEEKTATAPSAGATATR
ncbi:MAG: hypothetical protein KA795_18540 [Burkholderiaceae bacterium]|nr:hypothetical protein [Burkholderiaceae bacterium]